MGKSHIIWDWNGTLLDDVHISLLAANKVFNQLGFKELSLHEYRENYSVPVNIFYHNVMGREPTKSEWQTIGDVFNQYYKPNVRTAYLSRGAIEALQYRNKNKFTQSVCSLMEQDELNQSIFDTQVSSYFNLVEGRTLPLLKKGKSEQLSLHIKKLNILPSRCVVVGDAADDALSAFEVGAKAILYTGGTHCAENLAKTGAYLVDSLLGAAMLAEDIV
ncbi:HAD family hydrolase [Providencia vermicola]|uniref:phosphoglycolate phosphatase n=1 Tax=Providencia vermicola TaxID=333965 RepID=A0AAX3S312_9GAMM|nr:MULTISPECIES: HAD hydrolase-like protein [Providencia]ELX8378544.1 HAD family hydrolase [Providencia stuartii]EMD5257751.1 HAD family hydrolase [Providencia stuartii]USB35447.1 HAD hydrolase-like protein [Providencia vermicola]WFC07953.1 HAD hydrolase-like protein [Providencia vermicola]